MQYHSEKFLIVKQIKKFILDIEKLLINFPNKDYISKDLFYSEALSLLELVYTANEVSNINDKKDIQIQVLSKLNMLDFYLERAYKKKYISEKQCLSKSNELAGISKMVYGWIKNDRECNS